MKGFSGGMRRRLDIAMSLVARPKVLFLDEPTTGLDPRSRLAMWDLIDELVAEGTTTLLTTQYLDEADRLADNIVVVDHGPVIARRHVRGAEGDDGRRPVDDHARARRRTSADVVAAASRSSPSPSAAASSDGAELAHLRPPGHDEPRRRARARRRRHRRRATCRIARPTLDDVFLSLTGHSASDEEEERAER